MRIAVIADTHDRLPAKLLSALEKVDEIWHLGDVCHENILIEIESLGPPVTVVRGNCDSNFHWPLSRILKREIHHFYLIHIPPKEVPAEIDFVLHGHTHIPRDETINGVRFLNPGCITRPNRGSPASFGFLEITNKRVTWSLQPLSEL